MMMMRDGLQMERLLQQQMLQERQSTQHNQPQQNSCNSWMTGLLLPSVVKNLEGYCSGDQTRRLCAKRKKIPGSRTSRRVPTIRRGVIASVFPVTQTFPFKVLESPVGKIFSGVGLCARATYVASFQAEVIKMRLGEAR